MITRWMRTALNIAILGAGAGLVLGSNSARAGDLFDLTASSSSQTVSASGSSLIDLTNNLLKTKSQFVTLSGQSYSASLNYAGVANAVRFSSNAPGTSVTLSLPTTGFSRTFTGTSKSDVEHQIRTFIERDGAHEYARFLKSIDEKSPVGVVDGNPQAATAFLATEAFKNFGMYPSLSDMPRSSENDQHFRVEASAGAISTPAADGYFAAIDATSGWRVTDNVGLTISVPFEYRDVSGGTSYLLGLELGLPVTLIANTGDGFSWTLTPWGVGGITGSADLVAGGVLAGGGGTSNLNYRTGDFVFTLADQVSYETGIAVGTGDYRFETSSNQLIVKNGGKITYAPGQRLFVDAGIAYTNFIDKAAVPNYWTPTAGVGVRFSPYSGLRIGYSGDFGRHYRDNGGDVTLYLSY